MSFEKGPGCQRIDDILPGGYKLELINTGWIIWEGKLTAKELFQPEDKNLLLAAGAGQATKEIDLLNNGDLMLRTYPGNESGSIEIELTR